MPERVEMSDCSLFSSLTHETAAKSRLVGRRLRVDRDVHVVQELVSERPLDVVHTNAQAGRSIGRSVGRVILLHTHEMEADVGRINGEVWKEGRRLEG